MVSVLVCGLLAACTPFPRAELTTYSQTFAAFQEVSGTVLDIVAPYERMAIRPSTFTTEDCPAGGVLSPDPFCYEIRDVFATIGDPPLVGSYRDLIEVIARYNAILVAYSDGVSLRFIQQDLDGFAAGVAAASADAAADLTGVITDLTPAAEQLTGYSDRQSLLALLNQTFPKVDAAFAALARESGALFSNVATGTTGAVRLGGNRQTLAARRTELRNVIANWTVLIDETRGLLQDMNFALNNPDNLEVRLRNLQDEAIPVNAGFEVLRRQLAELGTAGSLAP